MKIKSDNKTIKNDQVLVEISNEETTFKLDDGEHHTESVTGSVVAISSAAAAAAVVSLLLLVVVPLLPTKKREHNRKRNERRKRRKRSCGSGTEKKDTRFVVKLVGAIHSIYTHTLRRKDCTAKGEKISKMVRRRQRLPLFCY